jgi:hypothetical protein
MTQPTTCDHLLDTPGEHGVSVVVDGRILAEYGGFEEICGDVVQPFAFLSDPLFSYRKICSDRPNCRVRVCGSVTPELRAGPTGLPLFTVCDYERADR